MNILYRLVFVVLLSGMVASCNSVIDFEQPGNLPAEDAIQTVDDMSNALSGLYENLDEFDNIYFNSVYTDEITIGQGNGGQGLGGQYQFVLDPTSDIASTVWVESYRSINELNRFIQAAKEINPGDQEAAYNDMLGQAYAMRAYEYFTLLSFYSPDLTDNSSLGAITFTDVPKLDAQRPRNTTGETFTQIFSDLDMAESNINSEATSVTRFTQLALTALRARIATYREEYSLAEDLSQEVLDSVSLAQPQAYLDMYQQDTQGEVIFKLARVPNGPYDDQPDDIGQPHGEGWIGSVYAQVSVTEGAHYQIDANLFSLYDQDDIRRTVTTLPDTVDGVPYLFVSKYAGTVVSLHNDQKIFRASEMALINAEAKVAQGDLPGAALMIQRIRSARNTSGTAPLPSYANEQEGFADVLLERRKELALEGHRWHDLARIGAEANAVIDRAQTGPGEAGCADYSACSGPVPGQSEKYTLPIPLGEISANSEIQQNPGYSGGS